MNPGELDEQITIKRATRASDGMGGDTVSLTDVAANLWAHVRALYGKEKGIHDRVEAPAMYVFKIRNRDDIKDDDQIFWDGDIYNIRRIISLGDRKMYLEIDAERGVTQ